MRNTIRDEKVASKLDPADKEKIEKKVQEVIDWLDHNQLAEVAEFEHHQKELEGVCNPIISKMYAGAGGAEGMPGGMPGGMPDFGGAGGPAGGSAGRGGPTVEEVD